MKILKIILLLTSILIINCKGEPPKVDEIWTSEYYNLSARYKTPWCRLPGFDTNDRILFGLIDTADGKSYIIKIANDAPQNILTDSNYFNLIRDKMLDENINNELIDECDTLFHNKLFHRQIYLMYTERWGLLKQYANIIRTGDKMISVQISFPVDEKNKMTSYIPKPLIDLDKNIKIDEK